MQKQRPPRGQAWPPSQEFRRWSGVGSLLFSHYLSILWCLVLLISSFRHCQKMQCIAPNSETLLFFGNMLIIIKRHFWFKLLERACCGAKPHKTCPTWFPNKKFFKKKLQVQKIFFLIFDLKTIQIVLITAQGEREMVLEPKKRF